LKLKKLIGIISVIVITGLIIYGYLLYRNIFASNTKFNETEVYVHIPTDANYDQVKQIMSTYVKDMDRFQKNPMWSEKVNPDNSSLRKE